MCSTFLNWLYVKHWTLAEGCKVQAIGEVSSPWITHPYRFVSSLSLSLDLYSVEVIFKEWDKKPIPSNSAVNFEALYLELPVSFQQPIYKLQGALCCISAKYIPGDTVMHDMGLVWCILSLPSFQHSPSSLYNIPGTFNCKRHLDQTVKSLGTCRWAEGADGEGKAARLDPWPWDRCFHESQCHWGQAGEHWDRLRPPCFRPQHLCWYTGETWWMAMALLQIWLLNLLQLLGRHIVRNYHTGLLNTLQGICWWAVIDSQGGRLGWKACCFFCTYLLHSED